MRSRLLELLKEHSLINGNVQLSSGKISDFYIDCKQTTYSAEGSVLVGNIVYEYIRSLHVNGIDIKAVGGLTMGADPIAVATSLISHQSMRPVNAFTIRKEPKEHGTGQWLEGIKPSNIPVLIVEDVVTTGASALKAVERAVACGLVPVAVFAIVDRLDGGADKIRGAGLRFDSVFTRMDFI